jgi:hypothetical protein
LDKIINIFEYCGAYPTTRDNPGLIDIVDLLTEALTNNERVTLNRDHTKLMTLTFIDELIVPLAMEFGRDTVETLITFDPPLEEPYVKQIERGIKLRMEKFNNKTVNP